jgi:iron complex outermembrane receptor protein
MLQCSIHRTHPTLLVGAATAVLALAAHPALAQSSGGDDLVIVATAVHVAPSAPPTDVVQPTSTIQQEFIQNNIVSLASFDDIVKFAPSVADQSPNGPGLGKSETLTIRGFQDGQFM